MSKKSFSGGLNALLESTAEIIENTPPEPLLQTAKPFKKSRGAAKAAQSTSQQGTLEGETRATFIVKEEHLDTLKALAYWDRQQIKDLMREALEGFFHNKGSKHIHQALAAYETKKGGEQKQAL